MDQQPITKVGIGVLILNEEWKVLLGKRKGSHGEGEYAFPGGHLEYMESFEDCVKREVKEECGIEIKDIKFQFIANVTEYAPKHYVHIGLVAKLKSGTPEVREPEKCESWDWYTLDHLPAPLFFMCDLAFTSLKKEIQYFDIKAVQMM